jgi:hypothetical protein
MRIVFFTTQAVHFTQSVLLQKVHFLFLQTPKGERNKVFFIK